MKKLFYRFPILTHIKNNVKKKRDVFSNLKRVIICEKVLTPLYFIKLFRGVIIPLEGRYFLVNIEWGSCFSLVYYDWGSYYFAGD